MKTLSIVILAALALGCTTMSEKDAKQYHMTRDRMAEKGTLVRSTVNPELIRGCRFLGRVVVRDSGDNLEYGERRLRNITGMMGGNFLLVARGQHWRLVNRRGFQMRATTGGEMKTSLGIILLGALAVPALGQTVSQGEAAAAVKSNPTQMKPTLSRLTMRRGHRV